MADTLTAFETLKSNPSGPRGGPQPKDAKRTNGKRDKESFWARQTRKALGLWHQGIRTYCWRWLGEGDLWEKVLEPGSDRIERGAHHRICRKRGSGEGRTAVWLWHMRRRVWLGNIMEMYRTANPGMTVRPRPWPRGVASSTELESIKWYRTLKENGRER